MAVVCGLAAGWLGATPAPAATPEEVNKAVEKAQEALYRMQRPDGTWENADLDKNRKGGLTALAVYALLSSGEKTNAPRLQKAIEYLKTLDMEGTYAVGCRSQIWQYFRDKASVRKFAERDRNLLEKGMTPQGKQAGLFDYSLTQLNVNRTDLSNSQYAILGMWACQQAEVEMSEKFWKAADTAWRAQQIRDGGWSYMPPTLPHPPEDGAYFSKPSMTLAGVATLFLTQEFLHQNDGLNCQGNISDPAIDKGLKWLADKLPTIMNNNMGGIDWPWYSMYGIERVGVASGYKYFGKVDWYNKGAEILVRKQGGGGEFGGLEDTCFGVLFLAYGRAPVVINKVQYTQDVKNIKANWNQRPRDVANFARWFYKKTEFRVNWQIVDLTTASVNDLLDAPIAYIAGNTDLKLSAEQESKLREFVERGGLILGNADCSSKNFADGFKKLGVKLFNDRYEWRELPADHVIYTKQQFKPREGGPKLQVMGLSNGARELMILLPSTDVGRFWQSLGYARPEAFEVPANIAHYATEMTFSTSSQKLRTKGDTHIVQPNATIHPTATLKVARLEYAGPWNPEPAGWPRLAAILHNENKLELTVEPVKLGEGKLKDYKVAHITGTTAFTLSDAELAELKGFLTNGGTLIADATGGNPKFTAAFENELSKIVNAADYKPLKADHPMYTTGWPAKELDYRRYARSNLIGQLNSPRIRGLELNGKVRVFFSPEDISCGLVGQPVDGISGFEPQTAVTLMGRMLLYSTGAPAAAPAAPAPAAPAAPTAAK